MNTRRTTDYKYNLNHEPDVILYRQLIIKECNTLAKLANIKPEIVIKNLWDYDSGYNAIKTIAQNAYEISTQDGIPTPESKYNAMVYMLRKCAWSIMKSTNYNEGIRTILLRHYPDR